MPDLNPVQVHTFVERQLDILAKSIEAKLDADVMAIVGPIYSPLDNAVRQAIETRKETAGLRPRLAIVLETGGGVIEVVQRMVTAIRHHYNEVTFIVPDQAMSAGTVFALSGDRIMMDYFSCLGPIDPQLLKDGKLIPALSYLVQFERLKERTAKGMLTSAELILLQKLDLAELHSFEQARELSNSLLKQWLAQYKFKNWDVTEKRKKIVTKKMREDRALQVAKKLMNHQHWHSHGRPISMEVLRKELKLKIDDFGDDPDLRKHILDYHRFLADYMTKINIQIVVHTDGVCVK